ncbi:hypothetical protein BDY21DRAFT_166958 [Lineolata rhizophorae]|uniref:Uncharacterized protein n=1 Tax=Lineolata rhizophorae TaxID=578093 RepID=A0A6A6P9N9_9PEZI|nr:hypothetical protein BDY21DRAFT_166958 [Lineolata rhizophorae]
MIKGEDRRESSGHFPESFFLFFFFWPRLRFQQVGSGKFLAGSKKPPKKNKKEATRKPASEFPSHSFLPHKFFPRSPTRNPRRGDPASRSVVCHPPTNQREQGFSLLPELWAGAPLPPRAPRPRQPRPAPVDLAVAAAALAENRVARASGTGTGPHGSHGRSGTNTPSPSPPPPATPGNFC